MATALDYNRLMFDEDDTEALAAEFRELEKHFGEEPEDGAGRVQAGEVVFATAENIGECVTYLNQSLQSFGIASKLRGLSADPQDYAAFCNAMYEMLQMRQRDMQDREQQADAIMRLESDKAVSITNVKKLTAQLDTKERDIGSLLIKERSAEAARKRQSEKLTADREEALRKCKAMQQRDTQFAHDLRKKDLDFSRLVAVWGAGRAAVECVTDRRGGRPLAGTSSSHGSRRGSTPFSRRRRSRRGPAWT